MSGSLCSSVFPTSAREDNMAAAAQVYANEYGATLVDILKWRAQHEPHRCAYSFVNQGKIEDLTYAELDALARKVAGRLLERGLQGQRAILSMPAGKTFLTGLYGCMYAGITVVPVVPPKAPADAARVAGIIDDCEAKIVLTVQSGMDAARSVNESVTSVDDLFWLAVDDLPSAAQAAVIPLSPHRSSAPAVLQYTSGSTGKPKGVMVTHANLMANSAAIRRSFGHDARTSKVVSWLPHYHDMGLVGGILQPLFVGMPCLLLSPSSFLKRPLSWLEAIRDYGGTTSGAPNFAFDLCVRRSTPEERASLDLRSWEVAFCGAEPIRNETVEAFCEAFWPSGFRRQAFFPCYGMAESTLIISGSPKLTGSRSVVVDTDALKKDVAALPVEGKQTSTLVSCGPTVESTTVSIVDPITLHEKPAGEIGEIWVNGSSVAAGYWNKPEETERTFRAKRSDDHRTQFLRTGDLGFVNDDGELFVTGRLKDVIIVRGANHYPQDIEATVQGCSAALRVGRGVAFSLSNEGDERLVIVQEVDAAPRAFRQTPEQAQPIFSAIIDAVAQQHGLRAHAVVLVARGTLPITSSGKLQRQATKREYLASALETLAAWIEEALPAAVEVANDAEEEAPQSGRSLPLTGANVEEWLCQRLASMLNVPRQKIEPNGTFGQLGVDSVIAMEAMMDLEEAFNLVLEPSHFYEHRTPRALANWISKMILKKAANDGEQRAFARGA
jgi:acyl-CoA synthetase (AMP-forming)/AMP-acid ligase II/acyl carrier protein